MDNIVRLRKRNRLNITPPIVKKFSSYDTKYPLTKVTKDPMQRNQVKSPDTSMNKKHTNVPLKNCMSK